MNLPLARDGGQRRGRNGGTWKYKRPFEDSAKAVRSISLTANLTQPARYRSGSCMAGDHIAATVPTLKGPLHRDLRVVRILRWAEQVPTKDSACSLSPRGVPRRIAAIYAGKGAALTLAGPGRVGARAMGLGT
jgi:hypothetical protein